LKALPLSLLLFCLLSLGTSYLSFPNHLCLRTEFRQEQSDSTGRKQPVYYATRLTAQVPVIDGKLNDECWKNGNWAGNFHQWIPVEGAEPTYQTELNIQYTDKHLYVAIRALDGEPAKISSMASGRDEIVGDAAGITFDSYRNFKTGFEFTVTAWGQKVDLVLFNPMNWDFNWNAVWKVKTGLEDSAWVAEYEIPLSQLRYSNKSEQVWGMHVWRWIARLSEESDWEWQSKNGPGMIYNFGELRGIENLQKSRRFEIMPFTLGSLRTMKPEAGNPFVKNGRVWGGNAGLDAKIGVSSNFTVDLTVNPDFGQVESDPSVMNLTAFETFYQEKRPFFMEGLTIFDYKFDDQSLFYSRRIGHAPSLTLASGDDTYVKSPDKTTILSALKFSGTTSNGLSVGVLHSLTSPEMAEVSHLQEGIRKSPVEPLTSYAVARIQKGYHSGNTFIGGMVTSVNRFINDQNLDFLSNNAYTGGLDMTHYWKNKEFYLDARLIGSHINGSTAAISALQRSSARYFGRPGADYLEYDPERTTLSGYGGKFKIGKLSTKHWKYSSGVMWLSPGLELNDLGYMTFADLVKNDNLVSYQITQPQSIFRTYNIELDQFNTWNFNGDYLGSGGLLNLYAEFKNNWIFVHNSVFQTAGTDTRFLRGGPAMKLPGSITGMGTFSTDQMQQTKNFVFTLVYGFQQRGDQSAFSYTLGPGITVRPVRMLKLGVSANISRNYDILQYITSQNFLSSAYLYRPYIFGTIDQKTTGITLRADLNITPEFSVQYYGSPFVSRGSYKNFKRITDPLADEFMNRYRDLGSMKTVYGQIGLNESGGTIPDYFIDNPDFNFHQFRSNLVAKWEYRPGSWLYLVWSGDMTGNTGASGDSWGKSMKQLFKIHPNNVFLVKLSYWLSL